MAAVEVIQLSQPEKKSRRDDDPKKINKFEKRDFGVATIVYSGKLRKNHKMIRHSQFEPDSWFGSRLRVGKVLAPYNACPKAVPLTKCANMDVVFKMFNFALK